MPIYKRYYDLIANGTKTAEQLQAVREIFPSEKESLGVLAIEIEKV